MDKKKLVLIIAGSVAAVIVVAVIVVSAVLANTPSALLIRATANTISDAKKTAVLSLFQLIWTASQMTMYMFRVSSTAMPTAREALMN